MNTEKSYTPAGIGEYTFSIPLYQRLFAWSPKEVLKLLEDLKEHFDRDPDQESPYYIGMITAIKRGNTFDLIDGQQRFSVITLLALVFREIREMWDSFLRVNNSVRLRFTARSEDDEYLRARIAGEVNVPYKNKKMEDALACIRSYIGDATIFHTKAQREEYVMNVYNRLSFFISVLPDNYLERPSSLNKYFEAMNSQGKGLEQHEILKVRLMLHMGQQETLTKVWNVVSDFRHTVIRKKEEDTSDEFRRSYEEVIRLCAQNKIEEALNKCQVTIDSDSGCKTIDIIEPQKVSFRGPDLSDHEDAIINFPKFLLFILDVTLGKSPKRADEDKLLAIFEKEKNILNINMFYKNLLYYRILMDYYVVRREILDNRGDFSLIYSGGDSVVTNQLRQFQAMLTVSSDSMHEWLVPYLSSIAGGKIDRSADSLLLFLKKKDNENHSPMPKYESGFDSNWRYPKVNRYWFWRLDYYLWERRKEFFSEAEAKVVEHYVFRQNRSIEHLHPQDETHNEKWLDKENSIHSFGNLAMISQRFNSQQNNDHLGVKFYRIQEQIDNRSLQSIKMYKMYIESEMRYENWTQDKALKHEREMIELLKQSFEI